MQDGATRPIKRGPLIAWSVLLVVALAFLAWLVAIGKPRWHPAALNVAIAAWGVFIYMQSGNKRRELGAAAVLVVVAVLLVVLWILQGAP